MEINNSELNVTAPIEQTETPVSTTESAGEFFQPEGGMQLPPPMSTIVTLDKNNWKEDQQVKYMKDASQALYKSNEDKTRDEWRQDEMYKQAVTDLYDVRGDNPYDASDEEKADYIESYVADTMYNFPSMSRAIGYYGDDTKSNPKEKAAMAYLYAAYEKKNIDSQGFKDMVYSMGTDITMLAGVGTLGAGFFARQAGKKTAMAQLGRVLFSPKGIAAVEGAAWGAGGMHGDQKIKQATDLESEYSMGKTAIGAGAGASLGIAAPYVIGGVAHGVKYAGKKAVGLYDNLAADVGQYAGGGMPKKINLKNLTDEEKVRVSQKTAQEILNIAKTLPRPEEMASVAYAGRAKRGWYENSTKALRHIFGDDTPNFVALLSALSPQTSVESNLRNALKTWKNWVSAGRPTDREAIIDVLANSVEGDKGRKSVLEAWINNSVRALTEEKPRLSGGKVESFQKNLQGDYEEVTQDAWMANYANMDQSKLSGTKKINGVTYGDKSATYKAYNQNTRKAAQILSDKTGEDWTPAEIQETVWSWAKALYEKAEAEGKTPLDILKNNEMSHGEIDAVADFSALLANDREYKKILEESGYGKQLDSLGSGDFRGHERRGRPEDTEGTSIDAESHRRNLERAGKRLTSLAKSRKIATDYKSAQKTAVNSVSKRVNSDGNSRGLYTKRGRGNRPGDVGTYTPNRADAKKLKDGGATPLKLEETTNIDTFMEALSLAKASSESGVSVYQYSPNEYRDMRLFTTPEGDAGFALKGEDIVSVFRHSGSESARATDSMIQLAIEQGGKKLDAFDGFLPKKYSSYGFKATSRQKWNPDYAPEGWTSEMGTPDVVYMVLDPKAKPYKKSDGKYASDYDDAVTAQNEESDKIWRK